MSKSELSDANMDKLSKMLLELNEQCQRVFKLTYDVNHTSFDGFMLLQLNNIVQVFQKFIQAFIIEPEKFTKAQLAFYSDYSVLCQKHIAQWLDNTLKIQTSEEISDRRFRNQAWDQYPLFNFLKNLYLIIVKHFLNLIGDISCLDKKTLHKIRFYMNQILDMISPTNFFATNPDILQALSKTEGHNFLKGFKNWLNDVEVGRGRLKIRMTDEKAFKLGENIAITPGNIIFQNELMQLIQYKPTTNTVYRNPLLIIPPCINKYYILDLSQRNSLVKWLVDKGYTIFIISWINPSKKYANKDFQDYMHKGPLTALDIIEKVTGKNQINTLGFCIGGTLLAASLAYLTAKNDKRISSATYLTTLLDFSEPGDLGIFIDEFQLEILEKHIEKEGFLDGNLLMLIFNLLRPNELIWSYYIRNYQLGEKPPAIDLLFWNSDSANLPEKMTRTYLREMYLNNRLKMPGELRFNEVPIVLQKIKTPVYFLSTINDHIAPWKSTYQGTQLHSGPVTFVLGGAGHIAGVVNHPSNKKYNYYINNHLPKTPEKWLATAKEHAGSWWLHWENWLRTYSGSQVTSRKPGSSRFKAIEDAPGSYVRVTLTDINY